MMKSEMICAPKGRESPGFTRGLKPWAEGYSPFGAQTSSTLQLSATLVQPLDCLTPLNQDTTSIDEDHGAGTETLAHQVKISLGEIIGFADSADRQPLPGFFKERIPLGLRHVSPQLGANKPCANQIDPDGRQFNGQGASQRLQGATNSSGHHPSFLRAQANHPIRQNDRARSSNL